MSTSEDENSKWCGQPVDIILWILIVISVLCLLYLGYRYRRWSKLRSSRLASGGMPHNIPPHLANPRPISMSDAEAYSRGLQPQRWTPS